MVEDTLRTAFARRDLLRVPVAARPRAGPKFTSSVLLTQQDMLGTVELVLYRDPDMLMGSSALGLTTCPRVSGLQATGVGAPTCREASTSAYGPSR